MNKTGDIKDLVIIEENGIAKGIRRIIAVTGNDAHEVQRIAEEFNKRVTTLERMASGPAKDQEVKLIQVDFNSLSISAITKAAIKERIAKIVKLALDEAKAKQKAEFKQAIDTINKFYEENPGKQNFVAKLDISANAKAISDALNQVKKERKDKNIYLFAADHGEDGKVVHACYLSDVSPIFSQPFS